MLALILNRKILYYDLDMAGFTNERIILEIA
jgi:hypothetical protein